MKRTVQIILFALTAVNVCWADGIRIYEKETKGAVSLTKSQIVYDAKEPLLVAKAAQLLSEDIGRVCGHNSGVGTTVAGRQVVILGTLANSRIISSLVKKKKLDASPIEKGWERYIIRTIDSPMRGVDKALVIVGSDRRGVAYGAFEVSEAIGVSPFYWWADIPVKHKEKIFVEADVVSDAPTIKYRGLFINDEDWGLKPWSTYNFEKELGDIGPKTYAKVCELILRMKGNMLAPAMHTCSGAFYSHPESKLVADTFGIVITTSHCEPLLLNNASKFDWDQKKDGDWDYGKNPQGILKRWKNRLGEAAQFENLYTMAMRGLHDAGLRGNYTIDERVSLLEKV
ncbi:MAG: glycosyl hydrolase 115 family protein, partial [Bacteroidaceae bacterium]|nr:glycosyl hydrolase 115 family protein [Bacteroidaceae bacterium]